MHSLPGHLAAHYLFPSRNIINPKDQTYAATMSSGPRPGPSKGVEKTKPTSLSRNMKALTLAASQAKAQSSSSSEDDRQATRAQPPLPALPTKHAGPSGVLAVGAGSSTVPFGDTKPGRTPGDNLQSHIDPLSDPFTGLIIDQSSTSVESLPHWVHPAPRWDAVQRRTVSRRPPFFFPSTSTSRGTATTSQPSLKLSDNIMWVMYPSPQGSPTHQLPALRRVTIPECVSGTTPRERLQRIRKIDRLAARVQEIREAGEASQLIKRSTDPVETRLVAWILRADRVNDMMPDLSSTTVWVNPFRLLSDESYNAWVKLFMEIYVLGDPS